MEAYLDFGLLGGELFLAHTGHGGRLFEGGGEIAELLVPIGDLGQDRLLGDHLAHAERPPRVPVGHELGVAIFHLPRLLVDVREWLQLVAQCGQLGEFVGGAVCVLLLAFDRGGVGARNVERSQAPHLRLVQTVDAVHHLLVDARP